MCGTSVCKEMMPKGQVAIDAESAYYADLAFC